MRGYNCTLDRVEVGPIARTFSDKFADTRKAAAGFPETFEARHFERGARVVKIEDTDEGQRRVHENGNTVK